MFPYFKARGLGLPEAQEVSCMAWMAGWLVGPIEFGVLEMLFLVEKS